MDKRTLTSYKKRLLAKRQELTEAYNRDKNYGRESDSGGTQDLADKASSSYTKEFLYSLSNTERQILEQVEEAIERMDEGEYGTCAECEEKITRKRLDAVPWARYCVPCQARIEQGIQQEVTE